MSKPQDNEARKDWIDQAQQPCEATEDCVLSSVKECTRDLDAMVHSCEHLMKAATANPAAFESNFNGRMRVKELSAMTDNHGKRGMITGIFFETGKTDIQLVSLKREGEPGEWVFKMGGMTIAHKTVEANPGLQYAPASEDQNINSVVFQLEPNKDVQPWVPGQHLPKLISAAQRLGKPAFVQESCNTLSQVFESWVQECEGPEFRMAAKSLAVALEGVKHLSEESQAELRQPTLRRALGS